MHQALYPTQFAVLLVEDSDDHALLVQRALRRAGRFEMSRARSVADATLSISETVPDLILLDLELPDASNTATLKAIRELAPTVAVVVLTSAEDRDIGEAAVELGAQDFISKSHLGSVDFDRVLSYAVRRQMIINDNQRLMSELHANKQELTHAYNKLQQVSNAKGEFLANVTHELRTPLTAMLGFLEIARDNLGAECNSELSDAIDVIDRNGNHLLYLVGNILDAAKFESNEVEIDPVPTSVFTISKEVVELMRTSIAKKEIMLELEATENLPQWLLTDPHRLRQILLNLVGNAVKYTEHGSVTVSISAAPTQAGNHEVMIVVRDTGIGMSAEQVSKIQQFTPFQQADSSITRRFGGTGLGLRISHAIAQRLGGSITLESELGKGSSVKLCFCAAESQPPGKIAHPSLGPVDLTGIRVLCVDDTEDIRHLIRNYLQHGGAVVDFACNGQEAISTIQSVPPMFYDIILLDLHMPGMDGLQIAQKLRGSHSAAQIFVMTADDSTNNRDMARAVGCSGFLSKPLTRFSLYQTIFNSCNRDHESHAA